MNFMCFQPSISDLGSDSGWFLASDVIIPDLMILTEIQMYKTLSICL